MFGTDLWSGGAGQFVAGAGLALLLWFGRNFTRRLRDRNSGAQTVQGKVNEVVVTLEGEAATKQRPNPDPGIVERMGIAEDLLKHHSDLLASLATAQGKTTSALEKLSRKVTPNGGNTRQAGDLLLLIAQKLDIEVPEEVVDDEG